MNDFKYKGAFMLQVLEKTLHVFDYSGEKVELRETTNDLDEYIRKLVAYINENDTIRSYKKRSDNTEVISSVKKIYEAYKIEDDNKKDIMIENFNINAQRLLRKEQDTQGLIEKLGIQIKKGSLIQVLLYDDTVGEYLFLLAKVQHIDFLDDIKFIIHSGFSIESNKLWKSCLLRLSTEGDSFDIKDAKVFLDNRAKYWSDDFLELEPMSKDDENTNKVFRGIEHVLRTSIKDRSASDYTLLRNCVIGYMKNTILFDYDNMMETVFNNYPPEKLEEDFYKNTILLKLKELPEKKKFDKQFEIVQSMIKAKIRKVYDVNVGIELKIKDHIDNINDIISSEIDERTGHRYIKIKTNNDETFESFQLLFHTLREYVHRFRRENQFPVL
jgi:hypothetical protein